MTNKPSSDIAKSGACIDAAKFLRMRAIIPCYVQQIRSAAKALKLQSKYGGLCIINVRINLEDDHDHVIHTLHTTLYDYTQPMVSMGAINARLLLEFLGLKVSNANHPTLAAIGKRRQDSDIGIECYQRPDGKQLTLLDPSTLPSYITDEMKQAWCTCINFANQRLVHITDDSKLTCKNVRDALQLTFETVPCLVECAFLNVVQGC
jgi:hypothetical protein